MNSFGAWLKEALPPPRAALGIVILLITSSFGLGAASVNVVGVPKRTTALEEKDRLQDALLSETLDKLERHIQQDSVRNLGQSEAIARIYCVVRLLADNEGPINPLACEPGGTE